MKSALVMKDLAAAKELGAAEMSAVRGGTSYALPVYRLDDFCGTPAPKPIKVHPIPGWPFPWPVGPMPMTVGPVPGSLPFAR